MLKYIGFIVLSFTIISCEPADDDPMFNGDADFSEQQDQEMMEDNQEDQNGEFDQQNQPSQTDQEDPQEQSGLQNQQDQQSSADQQPRQSPSGQEDGMAQSEAENSEVDVSDEELETYAEVSLEAEEQDIDPLQEQEQMATLLNDKELDINRYREIDNTVRQNQELQQEVEEIKQEKRDESSTVQRY